MYLNKSAGGIGGLTLVTFLIVTCEMVLGYPKSHVLRFEITPPIRNCKDAQRQGNATSGIYTIYPYNNSPDLPVQVFCDMESDGGGWTVIQRRDDIEPREDFFRTWMEYSLGFGDLLGEHWLGNNHIHALTNQALHEIRFDLADFDNNTRWAKYKFFYVHSKDASYKMETNSYTGDAGDSFVRHSGMPFITKDRDVGGCASSYKGGWWYENCHDSNLNGLYHAGKHDSYADGVNWRKWKEYHYSLKKTEMKIRPYY